MANTGPQATRVAKEKSRWFAALIVFVSSLAILFAADEVVWIFAGQISGLPGTIKSDYTSSYTPVVIVSPRLNYYYTPTNGHNIGALWLYQGTWSNVGKGVQVISKQAFFDVHGQAAVKTFAVVRVSNGSCVALLHVGADNLQPNLFSPAWASSPDCVTSWTYRGKVLVDGRTDNINARSANLIVQEEKPSTRDDANPANNRYLAWEDQVTAIQPDGSAVGLQLALIYSGDSVDWRIARDANGYAVDISPNDVARFTAGARSPFGYHLMPANGSPSSRIRHLYSCDGLHWRTLEDASEVWDPVWQKGTNLVYEPATGWMHALTSGERKHWKYTEQGFACPSVS